MLITLVAFFFILGFAITIHELGHFVACRLVGIPVLKFSLGFGPALIKRRVGTTDFAISILPLGGYVKMEGEEEGVGGFYEAPAWKRISVVFLGPLFNIISAFAILFVVLTVAGVMVTPYRTVKVEPGLHAARAGIMTGDRLEAVNGNRVDVWETAVELLEKNQGNDVPLTVRRNGVESTFTLRVDLDSLGLGPMIPAVLGFVKRGGPAYRAGLRRGDTIAAVNDSIISDWDAFTRLVRGSPLDTLRVVVRRGGARFETILVPGLIWDEIEKDTLGQINAMASLGRKRVTVIEALRLSAERGYGWVVLTGQIIYRIIKGELSRKNIGGPIAIAKTAGESARWGLESLFLMLSIISINLGIINLVPLPAFDGGVILMTVIEKVIGRPFSKGQRLVIQQIGFGIIILLVLFTLYNDLTR